MALVLADRVKETTTTTGTGTVTLLGASTGFQSFAVVGNTNTTYYTIAAQTGTEWEVGIGTYTLSGTTLARTTVLSSSNSGSPVNFSAGTKDVFVTYPSSRSVYANGTVLTATNSSILPVTSGGTGVTTSTGTTNVVLSNSPTLVTPALGAATATSLVSSGTAASSFTVTSGTAVPLTITNVGTGNSFVVEDLASPDASPFVIDSAGRVIVGNTAATTTLSGVTPAIQLSGTGIDSSAIGSFNYSAGVNGPFITTAKSRGGAIGTETIVQSGDNLLTLRAYGSDGVAPIQAAQIRVEVDGTPGVNDMPGRLTFSTTADGASSPTERMRISSTGQTTISGNTIISVTDNTNAALRITQLGTGNALLVEDSTNPDSTPVVIDNAGNLTVGAGTQMAGFGSLQALGTGNFLSAIGQFSADTGGAIFSFNKSRSTTIGSPATGVASGDQLGQLRFYGADGTTFIRAAAITGEVDGTPGTSDMPGRLVFSTTADGASTPTERVRIDSAGSVGIGGTASAGQTLSLTKAVTGAVASNVVFNSATIASDVTTVARGYFSSLNTQAAAFTLTTLEHFRANQPALGAGSTVTQQFGFNVDSTLTGANTNYGFYSSIASAANRYNFYAAGTADNYFAGNVGIGTTSPASRLHVRQDQDATTRSIVQNRNGTGTPISEITFITGARDLSDNRYAYIQSFGGSTNSLTFGTGNGAAPIEALRIDASGVITARIGTAIPAGGTAGFGYCATSTANFGVFFGSGAPTLSAAKGSLYLRSDGTTINDRMYVNTNGSTTWTNVVTSA